MKLEQIPTEAEIATLLGEKAYTAWQKICYFVDENYDMQTLWSTAGKAGLWEYKFRKSSKTLCALYGRENNFGFMVIYGKAEREKFEAQIAQFSDKIQNLYHEAKTYHDGKWIMVDVYDDVGLTDLEQMLIIKKKPKKQA